jgi:hypothetical protein
MNREAQDANQIRFDRGRWPAIRSSRFCSTVGLEADVERDLKTELTVAESPASAVFVVAFFWLVIPCRPC